MWVVYNKKSGDIATVLDGDPKGSLLKHIRDLPNDFEWDAIYINNYPIEIPIDRCKFINGGLVILKPESIKLSIAGMNGDSTVKPGSTVVLQAEFFNGFGKPYKASGTLYWSHDRGYIRPKKTKIAKKNNAKTYLLVPKENIKIQVKCSLVGFESGSIILDVE